MAKFVFNMGDWPEEITKGFTRADKATIGIMKAALYEGAKIIADSGQKAAAAHGLSGGFGVAPFSTNDDGAQTSVGFEGGYFTNRWGQRVPYGIVVNVLEYGSSRVQGTHFMTRAYKSAKAKAQAAMKAKFQEEITKLLGV
jgi:hypothetical protein